MIVAGGALERVDLALHLGEEGVDEEFDAGTLEGAAFFGGGFDEVGGVDVGEEVGDYAGSGSEAC